MFGSSCGWTALWVTCWYLSWGITQQWVRTVFYLSIPYTRYTDSTANILDLVVSTINSINLNWMEDNWSHVSHEFYFVLRSSPPHAGNSQVYYHLQVTKLSRMKSGVVFNDHLQKFPCQNLKYGNSMIFISPEVTRRPLPSPSSSQLTPAFLPGAVVAGPSPAHLGYTPHHSAQKTSPCLLAKTLFPVKEPTCCYHPPRPSLSQVLRTSVP